MKTQKKPPEQQGENPGVRADVLTRFKPGKSGNPAGRPKGRVELATVIKNFLAEIDPEDRKKKCVLRRSRLYTLLERIAVLDPRCLLAYGYGKPIDTLEVGEIGTATGEKPASVSTMTPKRVNEIIAWIEHKRKNNGNGRN